MTKKVLLCDDEVHILRAAELGVARAGFAVRIARDGQEAWEMIQQEPPDVLVTDVQMPRCDGLELCRRLRSHAATKELPIVLLTAKGFELDRHEIFDKWGVAEILAKPFSPRALVRLLEQIVAPAVAR